MCLFLGETSKERFAACFRLPCRRLPVPVARRMLPVAGCLCRLPVTGCLLPCCMLHVPVAGRMLYVHAACRRLPCCMLHATSRRSQVASCYVARPLLHFACSRIANLQTANIHSILARLVSVGDVLQMCISLPIKGRKRDKWIKSTV